MLIEIMGAYILGLNRRNITVKEEEGLLEHQNDIYNKCQTIPRNLHLDESWLNLRYKTK